jgi:hypothetical protein
MAPLTKGRQILHYFEMHRDKPYRIRRASFWLIWLPGVLWLGIEAWESPAPGRTGLKLASAYAVLVPLVLEFWASHLEQSKRWEEIRRSIEGGDANSAGA